MTNKLTETKEKLIQEFEESDDLWGEMELDHTIGDGGTISVLNFDKVRTFLSQAFDTIQKECIAEVRNLLDEFNEMDDNAMHFELRIRRPQEFNSRLFQLSEPEKDKENGD